MRKKNPKYKQWLKRRIKSKEKRRIKQRTRSIHSAKKQIRSNNSKKKEKIFKVEAPRNFSIKDNSEEVVDFFVEVLEFTTKRKERISLFFDLSKVERVTADAIIYLLAVIKDLQHIGYTKHNFYGNLPVNQAAHEFFESSGFLNYVQSQHQQVEQGNNQFQIVYNNKYDQETIKRVCEFVWKEANYDRVSTRFLYVLLTEMMLNTQQHAYEEQSDKRDSWYLYVRKDHDRMKFTFLDTGLGIPSTAKKKWSEKIFRRLDTEIIVSALDGGFRTQTGRDYRGKGLPKIKECVMQHSLEKLYIISNKACCQLQYLNSYSISSIELSKSLMGTIYYWEIKMKE